MVIANLEGGVRVRVRMRLRVRGVTTIKPERSAWGLRVGVRVAVHCHSVWAAGGMEIVILGAWRGAGLGPGSSEGV